MTDRSDDATGPESEPEPGRFRALAVESAIGLVIALLLLWTAVASSTDIPFVYQGL